MGQLRSSGPEAPSQRIMTAAQGLRPSVPAILLNWVTEYIKNVKNKNAVSVFDSQTLAY